MHQSKPSSLFVSVRVFFSLKNTRRRCCGCARTTRRSRPAPARRGAFYNSVEIPSTFETRVEISDFQERLTRPFTGPWRRPLIPREIWLWGHSSRLPFGAKYGALESEIAPLLAVARSEARPSFFSPFFFFLSSFSDSRTRVLSLWGSAGLGVRVGGVSFHVGSGARSATRAASLEIAKLETRARALAILKRRKYAVLKVFVRRRRKPLGTCFRRRRSPTALPSCHMPRFAVSQSTQTTGPFSLFETCTFRRRQRDDARRVQEPRAIRERKQKRIIITKRASLG